jgi:hypothetical protein
LTLGFVGRARKPERSVGDEEREKRYAITAKRWIGAKFSMMMQSWR